MYNRNGFMLGTLIEHTTIFWSLTLSYKMTSKTLKVKSILDKINEHIH